ncbi:MAG: agmatinase [Calditrichia bacterium]|nr:agmatinase [Calditrichia bacterium]NOQ97325.1 agmatinase [Calditrichia bacterium]
MLNDLIKRGKNYEGCTATFEEAKIVLYGAGFDGTSSFRPGSRFAPLAIRSETYFAQEDYSPYFDRDLTQHAVHDLGDVDVVFGNTIKTMERIETVSENLVSYNKKPVCLGGEHLVTLPAIKPLIKKYPNLHIIQMDAHLDLMDELFGNKYSHGSVMRRIHDILGDSGQIYQVGIRSGSKAEYEFARQNTRLFEFNTLEFLKNIHELNNKPIYLTLDLDLFDPSLISGTGTPEAGGIFFQEYIDVLKKLDKLNIVGADVVELSPQIDPTHVSSIVASKILRELLLII